MKQIITLTFLLSVINICAQPGSLDSSFGRNGEVIDRFSAQAIYNGIALQPDGKIVTAGEIGNLNFQCVVARYNANGSIDKAFGTNGKTTIYLGDSSGTFEDVAIQSNGKILVTGSAHLGGRWNQLILLRYNKNGTIDSSFGVNGLVYLHNKNGNYYGSSVKVQTDGKIVVGGYFPDRGTNIYKLMVARFLTNGKLDSSFSGIGKSFVPFGLYTYGTAIDIQQDGKIVGTGNGTFKPNTGLQYESVALFRLNTDGTLDKRFGTAGKTVVHINNTSNGNALKILSNGKIVVAGITYNDYFSQDQLLLRFNANGFVDSSFGTNGAVITDFGKADKVAGLDVQANGKIVVGGSSFDNTSSVSTVVRYLPNGTYDNTFGNQGKVLTTFNSTYSSARDLIIQPDGKILTANAADYVALARYKGDGIAQVAQQRNDLFLSSIKIYPNPVKDILVISNLPSSKTLLTISNNSGNVFKTTISSSSNFKWSVSDLKSGVYYLSIQNGDEKKSLLFLKQ